MEAKAAGRIARLYAAMADAGMDAFFVRDTSNIAWLTAFDNVFDDEQAHALLACAGETVMHTDSRYSGAARKVAAGEGIVAVDDARVGHGKWLADALGARELGGAVVGIEDSMTLAGYRAIEKALADASLAPQLHETCDFVRNLRAVKEPAEVARMKAAQAITDAAFSYIITFMKPGMTEREVQVELEDWMLRHGASGLAFSSIVACGANGASPHAIPGPARLEAGQCVVMDFGARAHGYCSDMTRTVFIGQPDAEMQHAYEVLRQANEQVEATIKPGVTGADMHQMAEDILAQGGFAGKMGHGLGHGVGIDIHEEPVLSPRNKAALVPGNVVTVEPGIYLEGKFGMRLEDFGVVTEDGFEVFTQSTHDMVIL